MRKVFIAVAFLLCPILMRAQATNVYVTPTGAATGNCPTGTGAAPNFTAAQYSTAGNWGNSAGKIGNDTVVLICGTFTGTTNQADLLYAQGSGTSGHPIVINMDTGANITSPQWGGGSNAAVAFVNVNYITLDGKGTGSAAAGTFVANGTIQNTANGSGLANNAYSTAIWISGATNIKIQNVEIANICQHTLFSDTTGCTTGGNLSAAISSNNSSTVTFTNNQVHDVAEGIIHNSGTTDSNIVFTGNEVYNCNQCIAADTNTGQTLNIVSVTNNRLHDMVNWDDTLDTFHHNFIFIFQGNGGTETNITLNGNYMYGNSGINATSYVFFDPNGGTITGTNSFNNLMVNTSSNAPANGYFTGLGTGTCAAYNNTIYGNSIGIGFKSDHSCTIENNIVSSVATGIFVNSGTTLTASDYNDFYNLTSGSAKMEVEGSANYLTVAAWTIGTGFDVHSITGNPNFSGTYGLLIGSAAIGAATNLTSLSIAALDLDKAGVTRPASGAWDIGAYNYAASAQPSPAPPRNLIGIVY